MTESQPKNDPRTESETDFVWTPDLICEFARHVAVDCSNSNVWSSDFSCEKSIMKSFIKVKKVEQLRKELIISETSNSLIVDAEKFNQLFDFLYNYKEPEI